jgi:hypothetical protein
MATNFADGIGVFVSVLCARLIGVPTREERVVGAELVKVDRSLLSALVDSVRRNLLG